jgi:hypothetical protein
LCLSAFFNHFGIIVESFSGHLGSSLDHVWVISEIIFPQFGVILGIIF